MYTAVSPSGISYDLDHEERKDCCIECGGRGFQWYETPEDVASFNAALDAWIDSDSDDECPEPSATGRNECERCKGSGTFPGDPTVHRFRMRAAANIQMLPAQ